MNSVQEAKNELEASIRYAENAISSAKQTIESMEFRQEMAQKQYSEQTGREQALEQEVAELTDDIKQLERDLTVKTAQAGAWKKEYDKLKHDAPTMPVIPKAVAIAIFREGLAHGAEAVATELDNASDIEVSDRECMGNFEVEYTQYIELSDHLDTDWLRSKADDIGETFVLDCLSNLCADKEFECRIHGVDDEANDSASA